jgi:hypothetical protein
MNIPCLAWERYSGEVPCEFQGFPGSLYRYRKDAKPFGHEPGERGINPEIPPGTQDRFMKRSTGLVFLNVTPGTLILLEVLLVVFLGLVKLTGWNDLGYNRLPVSAALLQLDN